MLALTYVPLLIFAGGFGSVPDRPHRLTTLMSYLPVQPVADAAKHALQHPGLMPARDFPRARRVDRRLPGPVRQVLPLGSDSPRAYPPHPWGTLPGDLIDQRQRAILAAFLA